MACDVRDAILACQDVEEIVIVTADPHWRSVVAAPGLRFVTDSPEDSLNDALRRGVRSCRTARPGCPVATLTADLPAMHSMELDLALQYAREVPTSLVPDAAGSGTTLYAARSHAEFWPQYGKGSRALHIDGGAREILEPQLMGIRQDVDTLEDLVRARALGLGRHTDAVFSDIMRSQARPPTSPTVSTASDTFA